MEKKKLTPAELEALMETATKATNDLRQTPLPKDLTEEQINGLITEVEKCQVLGYKIKIDLWLEEYTELHPSINFKEVLMKILAELPNTLSVAALKELIDYTGEKWNEKAALVTA